MWPAPAPVRLTANARRWVSQLDAFQEFGTFQQASPSFPFPTLERSAMVTQILGRDAHAAGHGQRGSKSSETGRRAAAYV
ncbi:hypothetical protein ACFOEY_19915 [Paracandidimonas soli]|uniref:hypothetical protein n=1 Tax=Paracandidimonas soli TaxID=1917182 RepID=UPI00361C8170